MARSSSVTVMRTSAPFPEGQASSLPDRSEPSPIKKKTPFPSVPDPDCACTTDTKRTLYDAILPPLMRLPLCIRLTGCLLLGFLVLCPSKVCGQTVPSATPSISKTFSLNFRLAKRHTLVVSTEYMRAESLPKPFAVQLYVKPAWRYTGVPITVGYSYALTNPNRRLVPVVGVGVSCYLGSVKQLESYSDSSCWPANSTAPKLPIRCSTRSTRSSWKHSNSGPRLRIWPTSTPAAATWAAPGIRRET